jgi:hypothetical protein
MIKRVQLPSGAIEYVDTNPSAIKSAGKKTGRFVKRVFSKITNILKPTK